MTTFPGEQFDRHKNYKLRSGVDLWPGRKAPSLSRVGSRLSLQSSNNKHSRPARFRMEQHGRGQCREPLNSRSALVFIYNNDKMKGVLGRGKSR